MTEEMFDALHTCQGNFRGHRVSREFTLIAVAGDELDIQSSVHNMLSFTLRNTQIRQLRAGSSLRRFSSVTPYDNFQKLRGPKT